jgi:hypothetical protein
VKIEVSKRFTQKLASRIEGFEFEVGILDDKPHKYPEVAEGPFAKQNTKTYAGGPVRKTSRIPSPDNVSDILIANMERLNINILLRPFQETSSEIVKFTQSFLRLATQKKGISPRRVENLLQAVVRNPILRQEYGKNKGSTADAKGFDRHLFDTGQLFKAIKARVKRV